MESQEFKRVHIFHSCQSYAQPTVYLWAKAASTSISGYGSKFCILTFAKCFVLVCFSVEQYNFMCSVCTFLQTLLVRNVL